MVLQSEAVELPRSKLLPSHAMVGHDDQLDDFTEDGFNGDGLQSRLTKRGAKRNKKVSSLAQPLTSSQRTNYSLWHLHPVFCSITLTQHTVVRRVIVRIVREKEREV